MKRISRLLFLSVFLASCADAITPIPNVTVTRFAEVTVTFTSVPTSTPTEVPPTPTETPDPNRPPDATGYDESKDMYTRTAEDGGTTDYWMPFQYGNDAAEGIGGHWFENRMFQGKDILLYNNALAGYQDQLTDSVPFSQYVLNGNGQLKQEYVFSHPDQMSEFGPNSSLYGQSFSSELIVYLTMRYYHVKNVDQLTDKDWLDFFALFKSGAASIPVGNDTWNLAKGYREFVVDYNVASKDPSYQKTDGYLWKIMVVDGQLTSFIATPEPNQLSDQEMRIMAFAPMWKGILDESFVPGDLVVSFNAGRDRVPAAEFSLLGGGEGKKYPNVTTQPTTNFIKIDRVK